MSDLSIPAKEGQEIFLTPIKIKPFSYQIAFLNSSSRFHFCPTLFLAFLCLFFVFSFFLFLTQSRTWRHMIRPPLIGIRFTGLDQHCAGRSQKYCSHLHAETSGLLGTWVCGAAGPPSAFFFPPPHRVVYSCHHAHASRGQTSSRAHMYDSFHMRARVWSEDPRIDTFHGLLAPWQWGSGTAETSAQCDEKN